MKDLCALQLQSLLDDVGQQLPARPTESQTLLVLLCAWSFTDKHEACVRAALAEHDLPSRAGQAAPLAVSDRLRGIPSSTVPTSRPTPAPGFCTLREPAACAAGANACHGTPSEVSEGEELDTLGQIFGSPADVLTCGIPLRARKPDHDIPHPLGQLALAEQWRLADLAAGLDQEGRIRVGLEAGVRS